MKSSKQTLAESSLILIFSTALVKVISALFKIPLASEVFLGDIGFGYFSVAHDLYTPFYVLAVSGLPVAVSHLIAEKISKKQYGLVEENFSICKRLFIILGLVFSLLLSLMAVPQILLSNNGADTLFSVLAIVPSVFLCFLISVYRGYFEGFSDMYPSAVSKVIEAVCKLVLGLAFSYAVMKTTGNTALASAAAMSALTVGTALSTVYLHLKLKYKTPLEKSSPTGDCEQSEGTSLKSALMLALPFALASLSASIVALLDIFTVKLPIDRAGEDYLTSILQQNPEITGEISAFLYGVRSKAFTVYNLIPTFTAALGVGALPVLTGLWVKDDKTALKQNVNYTLKLISAVTFPAGIGMAVLGDKIMSLLYSQTTALGGTLLQLYGFAAIFAGLAVPLTTALLSLGKYRVAIWHLIIGAVIKSAVSGVLVTIPSVNVKAAPIGTLTCYAYMTVAMLISLQKTAGTPDYLNSVLKPLFCALLCGGAAYAVSRISADKLLTVAAIFTAISVYFLSVFLTRTFTKAEIFDLPFLKKRKKGDK